MTRIGIALLAVLAGCGPAGPPRFGDVVRVELLRDERGATKIRVVVEEGPALGALLAPLERLAAKEPCACLHMDRAIFHRRNGRTLEVSLCPHCFDVPSTDGRYAMPDAFFRAFEAHVSAKQPRLHRSR